MDGKGKARHIYRYYINTLLHTLIHILFMVSNNDNCIVFVLFHFTIFFVFLVYFFCVFFCYSYFN